MTIFLSSQTKLTYVMEQCFNEQLIYLDRCTVTKVAPAESGGAA